MDQNPPKVSILQKLLGKAAPGATSKIAPVPTATTQAPTVAKVAAPTAPANGTPTVATSANGASANNVAAPSSGNAFTQLFGATNGISTANGVVRKPNGVPTLATLLGPKPTFSRHEYEEQEQKVTKIAKMIFQFSIVFVVGIYGYFYTQLEPTFTLLDSQMGPNIATRFESSNAELQKTQTDFNLIRFRLIRLMLDEINSQIDSRTAQKNILVSPTSTEINKAAATDALNKINDDIKKSLIDVQKLVAQPFGVDTFSTTPVTTAEREIAYSVFLTDELQKERAALTGNANANQDELRSIDSVIRLVGNVNFQSLVRSKDFGKISDTELDTVLQQIREEGTDQLSSIEKVRKQRINWAKIIADINDVTRKADLYYGQGLFKTVGGFLFSSYRFDAKTGRISITGISRTSDSKTFSFIAKLVDSIEKSPEFKQIDFRSFAKSLDESGDYSSSINLDFALQTGTDPRDDINFDSTNTPQ